MTTEITIRPVQAGDHDSWRRLWTAYLEYYETSVSEEVYKTSFQRLLSGDPGEFKGLVAAIDGKLVGLVHYVYHRSMWTVENTCYLMDLYSDPSIRGQGVGRALIEAVHEAAKLDGATTTYWMTQEYNYKGRMLYDRVATKTPFIKYAKKG